MAGKQIPAVTEMCNTPYQQIRRAVKSPSGAMKESGPSRRPLLACGSTPKLLFSFRLGCSVRVPPAYAAIDIRKHVLYLFIRINHVAGVPVHQAVARYTGGRNRRTHLGSSPFVHDAASGEGTNKHIDSRRTSGSVRAGMMVHTRCPAQEDIVVIVFFTRPTYGFY